MYTQNIVSRSENVHYFLEATEIIHDNCFYRGEVMGKLYTKHLNEKVLSKFPKLSI